MIECDTVTGDSSVSLHTYISIVYNIYVFFVSIYIKSMRDNARPDQGKSALGCTLIGSGPTNSRQKCRLKDDIYAELKRYISLTDLIYKHEKGHWNRRPLYLRVCSLPLRQSYNPAFTSCATCSRSCVLGSSMRMQCCTFPVYHGIVGASNWRKYSR